MDTPNLTPTSYVVLGCLALGGPATPYGLKQTVAGSIGYFWSFPHSQLYSEPERLARGGLVTEQREDSGRRRRTYAITDAGLAALKAWVATPTDELPQIRDIGMLKLYFASIADGEQLAELARVRTDAHRHRRELYNEAAAGHDMGRGIRAQEALALRFGIAFEDASIAFWGSLAKGPNQ
ncbi:MAG: PadR family transcriptional regulator [Mycobacteriales bacterium]